MLDDDRATRKPVIAIGDDLSALSIDELTKRLDVLHDEIKRVETAREAKRQSKALAQDFFKK